MTRRPPIVSAAIAMAVAMVLLVSAGAGAQRQIHERSITVSVVGTDDAPVTGLTPGDFTVREDGLAREVLRVAPAPLPTHVLLLVDDSQVSQSSVAYLRTGLLTFVQRLSAAAPEGAGALPQMALWTFGDRPTRRVDYAASVPVIARGIGNLFHVTGAGSYLIEALIETSQDLRKKEAARPVIVAFADESGPEFSNRTHKDAADALERAGVSFWAIVLQLGPQQVSSTEGRERAIVLGDVTRWSGGANKAVLSPQALDSAFSAVATQILERYLITYGRPESLVPPSRLEVDVKRRGVQVRASRWAGR